MGLTGCGLGAKCAMSSACGLEFCTCRLGMPQSLNPTSLSERFNPDLELGG